MILVKLGGSVVTNKEKALSVRKRAVDAISKSMRRIKEPLVAVHGGGSYGHYWSVRYDMHTRPARYGAYGVSVVKNSMVELDRVIIDSMVRARLCPYCMPPAAFMRGDRAVPDRIREMGEIAGSGMIPVTYGDALWYGRKRSYILSGDRIMTHLARVLRPRLAVFAVNVDGVYSDLGSGSLIREIGGQSVRVSEAGMDVTGGMGRKLEEAARISRLGVPVFFVNGNRPERIVNAVSRGRFEGTLLAARGRRRTA